MSYRKCRLTSLTAKKKDGRDADRKWFIGAIFQRFEKGDDDSLKSLGLNQNILKIVDIIFKHHPAPTVADDAVAAAVAPEPAPAPASATAQKAAMAKKTVPRGGSRRQSAGFTSMDDTTIAASSEPVPPAIPKPRPASQSDLTPTREDVEKASLRAQYGSHMDVVRLIFAAWRCFEKLYAEWKSEWTSTDEAYRK